MIRLPASALTRQGDEPAVWVVDPAAETVSLRAIDVLRFEPAYVVVASGVDARATSWSPPACRRCIPDRRCASGAALVSGLNLSGWALRNRSIVVYLMLLSVLAGVLAFVKLGRNEDPAFTIRTMVVAAGWPGATLDETRQAGDRADRAPAPGGAGPRRRCAATPARVPPRSSSTSRAAWSAAEVPGDLAAGAQRRQRHLAHPAARRGRAVLQRPLRRRVRDHLRLHRRRLHASASCATMSSRSAPSSSTCPTSRRSTSSAPRTR